MTQATRVFVLDPPAAARLESTLRERLPGDAEWRSVPHARFGVKSTGVVLTCYSSGKVVVQGSDLDTFVARFLDGVPEAKNKPKGDATGDAQLAFDDSTVGSDETGKGDYFGPLVVAACHADPSAADRLAEIGVTDSKALDDRRALRLAGILEGEFEHEVISMHPTEYNRVYAEHGNLNTILATLHATAIERLCSRLPTVKTVVVDRFAREELVASALKKRGIRDVRLIQVPRAERHPVVAAASIFARASFLEGLAQCSEDCGTDLHKGAGEPVDRVARRIVEIGGKALLGQVAKLHFKNTQKLRFDR